MQNMILAVQNNAAPADLGTSSAVVSFFRSMGGSVGVSALGALLASRVASKVQHAVAASGIPTSGHQSHQIPKVADLPAPMRHIYEHAFGTSIGELFLVSTVFALAALVAVVFIREVPLRTTLGAEPAKEPELMG
jgi:hypothetical protein